MSSLYLKNGKIYISYYDNILKTRKNQSLKLSDNPEDWKKAKKIQKLFDDKLQADKKKIGSLDIKVESIKSAFEHFKSNNSDKNPKTIKDYDRFYNMFIQSFNPELPCTIINKQNTEAWLNKIKRLSFKKNTIFGYFKQLRHFLNFLFEYEYTPIFIVNREVKPKQEVIPKIVFGSEDLGAIFSNLEPKKKNNNFKLLVNLLYYTGLRPSDILTIRAKDINLEERTVSYYSPKRHMFRKVAFHEALVPLLTEAINRRPEGNLLQYSRVENCQRQISIYLQSIGLSNRGYSARTFRKTFVTLAQKHGMNESVTKELVGHAHTSTTDKFYNAIDFEFMKRELKKFPSI